MRHLPKLIALLVLLFCVPSAAQDGYIRASRLGITFIGSLDHPAEELRYRRALLLGAGWNRWPLYWNMVEHSPGVYDWTGYDRVVSGDVRYGVQTNAILLGRPPFYTEGGSIIGLRQPVFSDGSDTVGAGKTPNAANPWASFVYQAVARYKPGGLLASQQGWAAGTGITVWEAWNEPDLGMFWNGSVEDYARLLKVTYLAAHAADPNAQVMFGGLAYGNPDRDDWLAKVLAVYANDPNRGANNWYMDMVGVHNYSYARRSGIVVKWAKDTLARYGLSRPIWLNESGVPVWDDYPGPTWTANDPASRRLRATETQQAAFFVQSTAYAWAEGAQVVFFHQLYDDCGNQPPGTNFPPHNGEFCSVNVNCWGDAHGLYRNERGQPCFSQHILPGSPRESAGAFYRLAQVFGTLPFESGEIELRDGGTSITFERPTTGERVVVMWNRRLESIDWSLAAGGSEARLFALDEQAWSLTPTDSTYTIGLPAATRDDYPFLPEGEVSAIGGLPFILVEKMNPPTPAPLTPGANIGITPGAITATQPPRPTVDPALDTTPPQATIAPLPIVSPPSFTLFWSGQDDSGIERYLIWMRVDGGEWQPWLETADTSSPFSGEAGKTYEFAAWAVDLAGNWSPNTELSPQAMTAVQ